MGKHYQVPYEEYPADWKQLGRKAGPIRNQQMIDANAEALLALWDGSSVGTKDMFSRSRAAKLKILCTDTLMKNTNSSLQERMRKAVAEVQRKSYPLSDLLPLMQEAIDELDRHEAATGVNR